MPQKPGRLLNFSEQEAEVIAMALLVYLNYLQHRIKTAQVQIELVDLDEPARSIVIPPGGLETEAFLHAKAALKKLLMAGIEVGFD
jgi:hypothetical protein